MRTSKWKKKANPTPINWILIRHFRKIEYRSGFFYLRIKIRVIPHAYPDPGFSICGPRSGVFSICGPRSGVFPYADPDPGLFHMRTQFRGFSICGPISGVFPYADPYPGFFHMRNQIRGYFICGPRSGVFPYADPDPAVYICGTGYVKNSRISNPDLDCAQSVNYGHYNQ